MDALERLKSAVARLLEARARIPEIPDGDCPFCALAEIRGQGPYCSEHYDVLTAVDEAEHEVVEAAIAFCCGDEEALMTGGGHQS